MLLDVTSKQVAVDCGFDDERRGEAGDAKRREKRGRLPMTVGHVAPQPRSAGDAAAWTRHVRFDPCFVDKYQPGWIEAELLDTPHCASFGNIRPPLLGRS